MISSCFGGRNAKPPLRQAANVSRHTEASMKLEEIYNNYVLNDGETISFTVDFLDCSCVVRMLIRKAIEKQRFQKCQIELLFRGVTNIDISEDFRTQGAYSDITFTKTDNGEFYLSLDPYGNANKPHENDNFIIVSSLLTVTFDNGEKMEIS
jgi:hypothetical protein